MRRLVRLNKGDTRSIKKALDSMHKALDELERVLSPRFALEGSLPPLEAIDEELLRLLVQMIMMVMMLDYMLQIFPFVSLVGGVFPLGKQSREVVLVPEYLDPARINWVKARGVLSLREFSILEARLGVKNKPRTLKAIGQDFSLTRERVRQIQKAAVSKLESAGLLVK